MTTRQYERTYETGRAVSGILEFFGWVVVVIGVLVAIGGFATGGLFGAVQTFRGAEPPFLVRALAAVPGLVLCISGLVSVMLSQMGVATLNSAEMQMEMLQIARENRKRLFGDEQVSGEAKTEPAVVPSIAQAGPIDARVEFPSTAWRITMAETLPDGSVSVVFDNGQRVDYASIGEARRFLA